MDRELGQILAYYLKHPLPDPPEGQTRWQQLNYEAEALAHIARLEGYDGPLNERVVREIRRLLRDVA